MNIKAQYFIKPKFFFSFDKPFNKSIAINNARLVNAFSGKGLETSVTKRAAGVSFGYKGLSKYIEGASGFTLSLWAMTYSSYFHTYTLASIYTDNNEPILRVNYLSGGIEIKVKSTAGETPAELRFVYDLDSIIVPFCVRHCNDGVWQLITVSVDYENNVVKLFVNGSEVAPEEYVEIHFAENKIKPVESETLPDFIGGDPTGANWSYSGIIDEIQLFDKAFSADEALEQYNSFGEPDTVSSTDDQRMLEDMLEKLGDGWAFAIDSSKLVYKDKIMKVDRADYSLKMSSIRGEAAIPADCVERYFNDAVEKIKSVRAYGTRYYSLKEICAVCNLNYLDMTGENGLFLVLADNTSLCENDGALLERLREICEELTYEPRINVEDTRTVVACLDPTKKQYAYSPSLVVSDGVMYASYDRSCQCTVVLRSTDNGETWEERGTVKGMYWASLFEHRGALYIIGTYNDPQYHMAVTRSTDGGLTWSEIREGQGAISYFDRTSHGAPTPVVKYNGRIYRVFESTPGGFRELFISADENSEFINPESWKFHDYLHLEENPVRTAETPQKMVHDGKWICEGNAIVGKDGRLYCLSRCESFPVHNKAFLSVLSTDGERLEALQAIDFFGGQTKFTARYDPVTDKYIAIVNCTPDGEAAPYQRNYAGLTVSDDLIHWELKEILLCDRSIMNKFYSMSRHGYQYVDWTFDGSDIVMVVREAQDESHNFHDNNYLSFYRVKDYSKLI